MQSFTTRYWTPFMATSTAIALWLAALTGCRSAVDDFYNPLLTPPHPSCGTGGEGGTGGLTKGPGGGAGGDSSTCSTSGGGSH